MGQLIKALVWNNISIITTSQKNSYSLAVDRPRFGIVQLEWTADCSWFFIELD